MTATPSSPQTTPSSPPPAPPPASLLVISTLLLDLAALGALVYCAHEKVLDAQLVSGGIMAIITGGIVNKAARGARSSTMPNLGGIVLLAAGAWETLYGRKA